MAPNSKRQKAGSDSEFDWKVLIDNGQADGGSSSGSGGISNRTASTHDPTGQPLPSRAPGVASDLIPLYCGLLGALICGLVLWIVLKHARSRGRDSKLQPPHSSQPTDDVRAPLTETLPDSVAGSPDEYRKITELPESQRQRLEQLLDYQAGWRALATQMGHDAQAISELESQASGESTSPAGLLLRRFCESANNDSSATVCELRRLLTAAGLSEALQACKEPQHQQHDSKGDAAADRQKRRRQRQTDSAVTDTVELTTV